MKSLIKKILSEETGKKERLLQKIKDRYEGKILSFKNKEAFIDEFNILITSIQLHPSFLDLIIRVRVISSVVSPDIYKEQKTPPAGMVIFVLKHCLGDLKKYFGVKQILILSDHNNDDGRTPHLNRILIFDK